MPNNKKMSQKIPQRFGSLSRRSSYQTEPSGGDFTSLAARARPEAVQEPAVVVQARAERYVQRCRQTPQGLVCEQAHYVCELDPATGQWVCSQGP